jgi:hypothetical protein
MSICKQVQRWLPQYVADGEPDLANCAPLLRHMDECLICNAYAQDLRMVEGALRSRPVVAPPNMMATRIMDALADEGAWDEEPSVLTWEVWVPGLALLVAIFVAIVALPSSMTPASHGVNGSPFAAWVASLSESVKKDMFWAIWSGIFVSTAGLGISVAMGAWDETNTRRLNHLEQNAADMVDRLWTRARRAH